MRNTWLSIAILLILVSVDAFAQSGFESLPKDKYLSSCIPTPEIVGAGSDYPGKEKIISSNKLAIPAGKSVFAPGEIVYLSGRVLDRNCVPVSDAVVEIWQTNAFGRYGIAGAGSRVNPYPVFAGNGRAVTDNLGRYNFVTVFPGPYGKNAPHIHVKILHPDFATLNTEIYFQGDHRNAGDPKLARISPAIQQGVMAEVFPRTPAQGGDGLNAVFDITLKGQNKFRRF